MEIRSRTLGAGLSIATRTLFFLSISIIVYSTSTPENAVDFFQLLFLQTVLITFLSASSYFRMLDMGEDSDAASNIGGHFIFSLVGSFTLPFLYLAVFPEKTSPYLYFLLGFGGGMASLSGALTGYTIKQGKIKQAFSPSIISALICSLLLFLYSNNNSSPTVYFSLITLFQVLTAFGLILFNSTLFKQIASNGVKHLISSLGTHLKSNLTFGFVNTYAVFLLFFFREIWSVNVDKEIASAVFFFIRISDIGLQLMTTVLASHPKLKKLPKLFSFKTIACLLILLIACLTMVNTAINLKHLSSYSINIFICQALVDLVRYPLALLFLYQVSIGSKSNYGWFVLIPISIVYIISILLNWQNDAVGIYNFITTTSIVGAIVFSLQTRTIRKNKKT